MNITKNYLAIDLGASSGRGIIGSFDGKKLTLRENCRLANEPVKLCGRLHWDILRIFHEIKNSIRQSVLDKDNIASIGIDTWGVDYGLIDKCGRLMSNPVHYRDARTSGITDYIKNTAGVSVDDIYAVTGIQSMDFNTIYQLASERRDDSEYIDRADKLLFIPDLLNYFLTGKMASEYTVMSTGAVLDAKKRALASDLLKKLGIKTELFAPIVKPCGRLGKILPSVLEDTGNTYAEVINVASHDTASAVLSVPVKEKGKKFIYISSGTWSLMGTELDAPLINSETCRLNYTNEGGAEDTIRFLKNIMGLWILQESRRQWKREGKDYSFAELEKMARNSKPFACLINPDDKRFAVPGNMPGRIAEYCRETGQYEPRDTGEIVRCIYESLALKYRMTAEVLSGLTGIKPDGINIVGGGSKDGLLNQMTANACGMPVTAGPTEATAVGNIAIQAIASGEIRDMAEARSVIADSFAPEYYLPEDRGAWDEAYAVFRKLK